MPIENKHIVLLTSEFPPLPGGIGNHAYNLTEQLSQSGYKVSVIADQRDNKDNEAKFDNVLKSRVYRVALRKSRYLMYLRRMWLCFKLSKSADYLICSGKFPLWIGAILKPMISAKTVAVIHGTEVNFETEKPLGITVILLSCKSLTNAFVKFETATTLSNLLKEELIDFFSFGFVKLTSVP